MSRNRITMNAGALCAALVLVGCAAEDGDSPANDPQEQESADDDSESDSDNGASTTNGSDDGDSTDDDETNDTAERADDDSNSNDDGVRGANTDDGPTQDTVADDSDDAMSVDDSPNDVSPADDSHNADDTSDPDDSATTNNPVDANNPIAEDPLPADDSQVSNDDAPPADDNTTLDDSTPSDPDDSADDDTVEMQPDAGGEPDLDPPDPVGDGPIVIVVLGSSTASGKNLDYDEIDPTAKPWRGLYEDYLKQSWPGSSVISLAKPGLQNYSALPTGTVNPSDRPAVDPERNITAALAFDPDAILVNFPSTVSDEWDMDELVTNSEIIVAEAADHGVPVWVATPQPNDTAVLPPHPAYELLDGILTTFGDRALDFWTPLIGDDGAAAAGMMLAKDGIHPTALGHQLLLQVVVDADVPTVLGR